jgi:hypothetical protein
MARTKSFAAALVLSAIGSSLVRAKVTTPRGGRGTRPVTGTAGEHRESRET